MKFPQLMRGLFALTLALLPQYMAAQEEAPAFRFAGRAFSREEAAKIAALPVTNPLPDNADMAQKLEAQREIIGGIALFSKAGIELSEPETLRELNGEILLMDAYARSSLTRQLADQGLTMPDFCQKESRDLRRQFAVAARQWYRKCFAGADGISKSQVRDWYFRHQLRFLDEELDEEKCFMLESRSLVPTVQAMLAQGSDADSVRQAVHALPLPADTLHWLNNAPVKREKLSSGFTLITSNDRILLLQNGARRRSYRKLDAELYHAIEQALYDALARARLDAALKEELKDAKIEF